MTAKFMTPGRIVGIDLVDARHEKAHDFGADVTINNGRTDADAEAMELTGGLGADVAIEAVGVPATFELCADLIRPGAASPTSASTAIRRRSTSSLWTRDVTITTGSSTPSRLRSSATHRRG